jgi:hypothetical protein
MRRATVTLADDLHTALQLYLRDQAHPTVSGVMQAALRQFLEKRGYLHSRKSLHITPAKRGSGLRDVSLNHDRYLAE